MRVGEIMILGRSKNRFKGLEKRLGYSFRKKSLLETALCHRSFRFESHGVDSDNQRLEFLGDAVLGLVAAARIYDLFEDSDEGALTRLRSRITSGKALAILGREIDLGQEIRIGKGEEQTGGRGRASNIADAVEAIIGAAYIDGGLKAAERIFSKVFMPKLDEFGEDMWAENPKGKLQAVSQRRWGCGPEYRVAGESGPPHARRFSMEVSVDGSVLGRGEGGSKQSAEVRAATSALQSIAHGPESDASADEDRT
jgi:ribonuclease-3